MYVSEFSSAEQGGFQGKFFCCVFTELSERVIIVRELLRFLSREVTERVIIVRELLRFLSRELTERVIIVRGLLRFLSRELTERVIIVRGLLRFLSRELTERVIIVRELLCTQQTLHRRQACFFHSHSLQVFQDPLRLLQFRRWHRCETSPSLLLLALRYQCHEKTRFSRGRKMCARDWDFPGRRQKPRLEKRTGWRCGCARSVRKCEV